VRGAISDGRPYRDSYFQWSALNCLKPLPEKWSRPHKKCPMFQIRSSWAQFPMRERFKRVKFFNNLRVSNNPE
jgi:hypothetical protein